MTDYLKPVSKPPKVPPHTASRPAGMPAISSKRDESRSPAPTEIIKLKPLHATATTSDNKINLPDEYIVESKAEGSDAPPQPAAYPVQQNLGHGAVEPHSVVGPGLAMHAGSAANHPTLIPTLTAMPMWQQPTIIENPRQLQEDEAVQKGPSVFDVSQKDADNFKPSSNPWQRDLDFDIQQELCHCCSSTVKIGKICHTLQLVLCCISILLCLWPLSCVCLYIAMKTSDKVITRAYNKDAQSARSCLVWTSWCTSSALISAIVVPIIIISIVYLLT